MQGLPDSLIAATKSAIGTDPDCKLLPILPDDGLTLFGRPRPVVRAR